MFVTPEKPHMYFDVDYTLIRPWGTADVIIEEVPYQINKALISEMRVAKSRGHAVVVWSQGGSDWARRVCEELAITDLVDVVIAKPSWFTDDKPPEEILDVSRHFFRDF